MSDCLVPALALLATAACRPQLEPPEGAGGAGGAGGGGTATFALEPAAPADSAPLALRVRIAGAADADGVHFVEGDVGPGHLRQLAADDPSAALEKRLLPASVWRDGGDLVVAPHARLVPGAAYAVAVADRRVAFDLLAVEDEVGLSLLRVWPPEDSVAAVPSAIYCGASTLPPFDVPITLSPSGAAATLARGAASTGAGERCARFDASLPIAREEPLIPPPAVEVASIRISIDPAPLFVGDAAPSPVTAAICQPGEIVFGPGCARVSDDRAIVRTPAAPLLWVVAGPGLDLVTTTAASSAFAVHPLPVASAITLQLSVADAAAREVGAEVAVVTASAMPHVVLNEVLSNPVGPDATSEWIELVNDGLSGAPLGGLRVLDVGGSFELPAVTLAPGAFAVLVDEDWVPDPALDAAPAPGALVLRVPKLGQGGLANAGELLRLVDADDAVLSAIPATPSPDAGTSTARREPWLADAPSSFAPGIATPGSPNRLEQPAVDQ